MKGVVFTGFLEWVEQTYGIARVNELIDKAGLEGGGAYTSVGNYSHQELFAMLDQLADIEGEESGDLQEQFAAYFFSVLAAGYGRFFERTKCSFDVFKTLDKYIHPEVKKLYPEAELPGFEPGFEDENTLHLVYSSDKRMYRFAKGLILACMSHFKEQGDVTYKLLDKDGRKARFEINVR